MSSRYECLRRHPTELLSNPEIRARVDNVFNGRHTFNRTVYAGFRDRASIAFIERHDDLVGPLFSLSVKGTF